jgi:hypothetical protein
MTSLPGRLYALAAALVVFFLAWAVVAARPWASTKAAARDPQLVALAQREQRLRTEASMVQKIVAGRFSDYRRRFAAYKAAMARRQAAIAAARSAPVAAAAPAYSGGGGGVRVMTLPPLVVTRTS